jgi:hypothetical protein
VAIFYHDPKEQFNPHIDAPAEETIIEKQARLEGKAGHSDAKTENPSASVSEAKNEEELLE